MRRSREIGLLLLGIVTALVASGCRSSHPKMIVQGDVASVSGAAVASSTPPSLFAELRSFFVAEAEAQAVCDGVVVEASDPRPRGSGQSFSGRVKEDCRFRISGPVFPNLTVTFIDDSNRNGRRSPGERTALFRGPLHPVCNGTILELTGVRIDFATGIAVSSSVTRLRDGCNPNAPTPSPLPGAPTPTMPPVAPTPTPPGGGPGPAPAPFARAAQVTDERDLIGGVLARGRIGDFLLENELIRVIVQSPGRKFMAIMNYGGNIIDADVRRQVGPDRDNFEIFSPGINLEGTAHYTDVRVIDDGSNGGRAIVRATGPDDLLDFANVSSLIRDMGFNFPASADDVDLPIEVRTDYSIAPGEPWVRVDTTIVNQSGGIVSFYFAEYLNGSGEVEVFQPGTGFGEVLATTACPPTTSVVCTASGLCDPCNLVAYAGHDGARGVSYGWIHNVPNTSSLSTSGVTGPVLGQQVVPLLADPTGLLDIPNFFVLPGGDTTITRWFAVGDGGVGSITDIRNRIFGVVTGTIEGAVTDADGPVDDAEVAVLGLPYPTGPEKNVVTHFRTDENGFYRGTLPPGLYQVLVNRDGRLRGSPAEPNVLVLPGATMTQNFTLPRPGLLRVLVRDPSGDPLPAKVQLVGFDPTPDPGNELDLLGLLTTRGGVFGDLDADRLPHGIAFVAFADVAGDTGIQEVEPGTYVVAVSHGPRFSAFTQPISITEGALSEVQATIAQVLDPPSTVLSDFHVHGIDSPDSEVTRDERLATYIAEGVEFIAFSDHSFRADYRPDVARLGLGDHLAATSNAEITTFDYGHFNSYPVTVDSTRVNGGTVDWGRAGVAPGMDFPSRGSFSLSPAELFAAAKADPMRNVVQINHVDGFFGSEGLWIDTGVIPPQSDTSRSAGRRLDPSVPNMFDAGFDVLELFISVDGRAGVEGFLDRNLGDWVNLLNQGIVRTGVADSDTHDRRLTGITGGTWVSSEVTDPAVLQDDPERIADALIAGQAIGTTAPFLSVRAVSTATDEVAGLGVGESRNVTAPGGTIALEIDVTSPSWAEFDRIDLFVNAATESYDADGDGATPNRYAACPTRTLHAGSDFTVNEVDVVPGVEGATRLEASVVVPLALTEDAWIVVLVRGSDGVSRPLFPFGPNDIDEGSNQSLADLMDGNIGEGGIPAMAFSNPLLIDASGDGAWTAPNEIRSASCDSLFARSAAVTAESSRAARLRHLH